MYHCHVEATEHIQMGMVGNLYIDPKQNRTGYPGHLTPARSEGELPASRSGTSTTTATAPRPSTSSTRSSSAPSTATSTTSTSPSSRCRSRRWTTTTRRSTAAAIRTRSTPAVNHTDVGFGNQPSQPLHSKIEATAGQRVLLRLSNLAVTRFYTIGSTIPMRVVGQSAKLLRGPERQEPLLQDQLPDARRRRIVRRDPRHRGRGAGHVPPLHHEPQLLEQRRARTSAE